MTREIPGIHIVTIIKDPYFHRFSGSFLLFYAVITLQTIHFPCLKRKNCRKNVQVLHARRCFCNSCHCPWFCFSPSGRKDLQQSCNKSSLYQSISRQTLLWNQQTDRQNNPSPNAGQSTGNKTGNCSVPHENLGDDHSCLHNCTKNSYKAYLFVDRSTLTGMILYPHCFSSLLLIHLSSHVVTHRLRLHHRLCKRALQQCPPTSQQH